MAFGCQLATVLSVGRQKDRQDPDSANLTFLTEAEM
jgi:hypothetical protein